MYTRALFATVGLLLLCPTGRVVAQTDLRAIELTTLVLDGERLYLREASGRLAPLLDGRYLLPRDAEVTIALGRVSRFSCPGCPQTTSSTIDGSTFKTNDRQCALEYSVIYRSSWQMPMIYPPKIVKWEMGTRLTDPAGPQPSSSGLSIYLVVNLSSLRLIHIKPYNVSTTKQLSVGAQSGLDNGWPEWADCGEPDPVVVAAREEKHKTELVAASLHAVRQYLAAR